ncbi:MAG: putative aminopeptidase [Acidobacteriaceae bacterium]|nr:putative aminopeptidase [Acidobacteriaceae bacterium]
MKLSLRLATAATLLPLTLSAQSPATPDWDARGKAWFAHVQYLASDELQGRRPGTPGFDSAVAYVQQQFQSIGLKPAGLNGYLQPVPLDQIAIDPDKSSIALSTGLKLDLGKDITLSPHITTGAPIDVPLIFVGYGLDLPTKHINDLAGLDLKGKVVVLYNASPANVLGPLRAYSRIAAVRWKSLHAAGAIGIIAITPPRPVPGTPAASSTKPAAPAATPAPRATYVISDPALETLPGLRLNATLTSIGAEKLFANTGHTFAKIKALADEGKPLSIFPFTATLQATTTVKHIAHIDPPNVVGELEGSDRKLKHEYVVISAHLDHLGVGRAVNGDTIYNGAMDNASGIASVIEVAKLLVAEKNAGHGPKRSILFIALTGEELGELGSQYFATKPTVTKSDIVADLNMDMYLPLFPLRYLEIQGLGESTLGNDARAVCQLNDVEPQFDKQPDENRFIRSDQVNFVNQGIPALAFKFGWTPDSAEMKTFNEWVKTRYHQPSDDLQQPIDKVAAAQFTSLLAQLSTRVANNPQRPTWYPESFFSTIGK